MQNDEKTWSVILSPHVPKYIQLFDNKDDFINSWTQVDSSVRSRDFHVNFILLYKLENCMTHREPVVRSRSKFLFAPDQHLDWDKGGGGFLVGHLTSLSCLPLRHWEKSVTFPVRLVVCLNFRVFHIKATEACLSIHNHQEKLSVIPTDQTAFTSQWLSQTIYGLGNFY